MKNYKDLMTSSIKVTSSDERVSIQISGSDAAIKASLLTLVESIAKADEVSVPQFLANMLQVHEMSHKEVLSKDDANDFYEFLKSKMEGDI